MRILSLKCWFIFFVILLVASNVQANETIRSSVSSEFRDGLQEKYLRYLSDKMSMDLHIFPMPFARRLRALKKGEIDIMVGLKGSQPQSDMYYKLQPSYEQIRSSYFLRVEDEGTVANREDLKKLVAGLTIDEQSMLKNSEKKYLDIVTVTTLHQKIELLMLKRIDTFLHFEQSAQHVLEQEGLSNKIISASLQDGVQKDYYIAISTKSPLYHYKEKLEAVIKQGIESNDFMRIRLQHYKSP